MFEESLIGNFLHPFLLNHYMTCVSYQNMICFGAQLVSHNKYLDQIFQLPGKAKQNTIKIIIQREVFFKISVHHFLELLFCSRYSCAHKFTYPLQNMEHFNNFIKIRGIMKIACSFLFI